MSILKILKDGKRVKREAPDDTMTKPPHRRATPCRPLHPDFNVQKMHSHSAVDREARVRARPPSSARVDRPALQGRNKRNIGARRAERPRAGAARARARMVRSKIKAGPRTRILYQYLTCSGGAGAGVRVY